MIVIYSLYIEIKSRATCESLCQHTTALQVHPVCKSEVNNMNLMHSSDWLLMWSSAANSLLCFLLLPLKPESLFALADKALSHKSEACHFIAYLK